MATKRKELEVRWNTKVTVMTRRARWTGVLLGFVVGCSNHAEVWRAPEAGGAIRAKILSSDRRNVYLQHDPERIRIPRDEIEDIDHPGDGAAIAGGVLSAYGVLNIVYGLPLCEQKGSEFCTGVFLPLTIGIPIVYWGIATYVGSVSAASKGLAEGEPVYSAPPSLRPVKRDRLSLPLLRPGMRPVTRSESPDSEPRKRDREAAEQKDRAQLTLAPPPKRGNGIGAAPGEPPMSPERLARIAPLASRSYASPAECEAACPTGQCLPYRGEAGPAMACIIRCNADKDCPDGTACNCQDSERAETTDCRPIARLPQDPMARICLSVGAAPSGR